MNGAQVRVEFAGDGGRFSGPSIEMINFGIKHKLKGRESIKDIAKLIIKLIDKKIENKVIELLIKQKIKVS